MGGHTLSARQQAQLKAVRAGISVGYRMSNLHAKVQSNGTVLVTGRMTNSAGVAPPPVGLYTYRLSGTITNAAGQPVQGAVVVGRTNDRDFWTFSSPSDADGRYTSLFHASDELDEDPVPINIGVALGQVSYGGNLGTRRELRAQQERDARHPAQGRGELHAREARPRHRRDLRGTGGRRRGGEQRDQARVRALAGHEGHASP